MGDTKENNGNAAQEPKNGKRPFPFIDSLNIGEDIEQIKADERYQEF